LNEDTSGSDTSERSLELGKMTAEGATALLFGEIASKLVGVVGSIVLIRLLVNPSIYAPIAAATTIPGLVMLGDLTGVNSALTRTLAYGKRIGDSEAIWSSYWVANLVKVVTGAGLSVLAFFIAQPVAVLLGKQSVESYLRVASPLPLVWTVQVNIKSTLISLGRARDYSWLQIVNEVLLSFTPIPAVLLGFGAMGALIAMVFANFAYLAIGLAVSTSAVLASTSAQSRRITYGRTAKKLVSFGLPLGLSNSFGSFVGQVVNLIILRFVSLYIYGLYSVALSASALMNSINDPLGAMTFPIYSRIKGLQEVEILQTVYRHSVRYSTMILLPFALFFIVYGGPFMTLFFGSAYSGGGIYLTFLSLSWLTIGMGWPSNVLPSQGYSGYTGAMGILSSAIGAAIAIATVPTLGLLAYVLISNLAGMPSYVLLVRKAKSSLSISPPYSYVKAFYGALLLSGVVSFGLLLANLGPVVEVIAGAVVVAVSFVVFSALLRALTTADARRLGEMMSTQPKVFKVAKPFIWLLERIVRFVQREPPRDMDGAG
jgi:O-antigen/teichoic acid export membrane protein